jgi:hypothetical protein
MQSERRAEPLSQSETQASTAPAASTSERAAATGVEKLEALAQAEALAPDARRISIRFGQGDMTQSSQSMCTHLGEQIEKIAVLGSGHFGTVFLVRHGPADTLSLSPLSSKNLRALKMMSKAKNQVPPIGCDRRQCSAARAVLQAKQAFAERALLVECATHPFITTLHAAYQAQPLL